jgi:hypothetical protein
LAPLVPVAGLDEAGPDEVGPAFWAVPPAAPAGVAVPGEVVDLAAHPALAPITVTAVNKTIKPLIMDSSGQWPSRPVT